MLLPASNEYCAVMDACVLAPMPLCDTLLRCAEDDLFRPRWSVEILEEVRRTLLKFGRSESQAERRLQFMKAAFPEACVPISPSQLRALPAIPDPGDKHVIAAAIHVHARAIVTFNLRHFPAEILNPHGILACSPDEFLVRQFLLHPVRMIDILETQSVHIRQGRSYVLGKLRAGLPLFVAVIEKEVSR
jgi:predicted nucleic acid-binding protein